MVYFDISNLKDKVSPENMNEILLQFPESVIIEIESYYAGLGLIRGHKNKVITQWENISLNIIRFVCNNSIYCNKNKESEMQILYNLIYYRNKNDKYVFRYTLRKLTKKGKIDQIGALVHMQEIEHMDSLYQILKLRFFSKNDEPDQDYINQIEHQLERVREQIPKLELEYYKRHPIDFENIKRDNKVGHQIEFSRLMVCVLEFERMVEYLNMHKLNAKYMNILEDDFEEISKSVYELGRVRELYQELQGKHEYTTDIEKNKSCLSQGWNLKQRELRDMLGYKIHLASELKECEDEFVKTCANLLLRVNLSTKVLATKFKKLFNL